MTYNISAWKQKECNLTLDLAKSPSVLKYYGVDVRLDLATGNTMPFVAVAGSEGFSMKGTIETTASYPVMHISHIENWGQGSGTFNLSLTQLLELTTGRMEAVIVWEGGDSVQRLIVEDGVVTEQEMEL